MATDAKFWLELARGAGATEEQLKAAEQVLSNEAVVKKWGEGYLRHDDYSRQSDELRNTKTTLQTWYQDALKTFEENKNIVAQLSTQLNSYRETYGDLTSGNNGNPQATQQTVASPATGDWVSKKDFETSLATKERQLWEVTKILSRCGGDYQSRFGEGLPIDELEKFALERGLPLSAAYDAFIRPKLDEKASKDFDEKLKRAREEGAREALSKHNLPVDTRPPEPHFLFDRKPAEEVPQTDHERVSKFTDFFNSPEMAEAARK